MKTLILFLVVFLPTGVFRASYEAVVFHLDGHDTTNPSAINDYGQVVGYSNWSNNVGQSGSTAWVWDQENGFTVIEVFGKAWNWVTDINNQGQVVGYADHPVHKRQAFLWSDGVLTDLGEGYAMGINNFGEVVGGLPDWNKGDNISAWVWTEIAGRVVFDYGDTRPMSINDDGIITGASLGSFQTHQPFIFDEEMDYINLPAGFNGGYGMDINSSGEVAGHMWVDSPHTAFLWDGEIHTIGTAWAYGINDSRVVVGQGFNNGFIWSPSDGYKEIDDVDGHDIEIFWGVNNKGQIVGRSGGRGILLTPVEEPDSEPIEEPIQTPDPEPIEEPVPDPVEDLDPVREETVQTTQTLNSGGDGCFIQTDLTSFLSPDSRILTQNLDSFKGVRSTRLRG